MHIRRKLSNSTSEKTNEEKLAGGYIVISLGKHDGGMRTELIFNAAQSEERGVRVGIVEEGRLVEMWHEHAVVGQVKDRRCWGRTWALSQRSLVACKVYLSTSPGKVLRIRLCRKGVDEPALALCLAEGPREEDDWGDECGRDSKDENTVSDAVDFSASSFGAVILPKAGGRWAKAWAEGVGTSDDFNAGTCSGNVTDVKASADVEYDSSKEEARDLLSLRGQGRTPKLLLINGQESKNTFGLEVGVGSPLVGSRNELMSPQMHVFIGCLGRIISSALIAMALFRFAPRPLSTGNLECPSCTGQDGWAVDKGLVSLLGQRFQVETSFYAPMVKVCMSVGNSSGKRVHTSKLSAPQSHLTIVH